MIRLILTALLLLLPGSAWAAVRVVATVPDLAAIAAEVGGEDVKVTSLALPTQDPHFVDAKPSLALALSRADLLVAVGLELEVGWLPPLQQGARNPKVQMGSPGYLDCSQFVTVLEVPVGRVDRSLGDVHPGGSPHYLVSPEAVKAVAAGMAQRLGELDPDKAAAYQARAADFAQRIDHARGHWESQLAPLKGAPVVQYHRSWAYLQEWVGFEVVADVEPKPGIPPSPAHVARVVQTAKTRSATLLLQERYYPDSTARQVADKAGMRLVRVPGGTDFARGQTWLEHMDEVVAALAGGAQ